MWKLTWSDLINMKWDHHLKKKIYLKQQILIIGKLSLLFWFLIYLTQKPVPICPYVFPELFTSL
jgi:hypothetical protein